MLYEELHSKVINFYGYSVALLEEPVVMDAVKELVNDRKKLLADKRALMLEVKQLKEHLSTPASPPVEDESTSPSSPSGPRDGLDAQSRERSRLFEEDSI